MPYNSTITIELLSMFRWKETGWKTPVSLISPDVTIKIAAHDSCSNNRWSVQLDNAEVNLHNDLADESLKEKLVAAVKSRLTKDMKIIQIFGDSMRRGATKRLKAQANIFSETNYRIDFSHKYRFIVVLEGTSLDKLDGVYLVPSYLPAPKDGYDEDSFYKMLCYERV